MSCTKVNVTNISKDKRIILQKFKNGNIKTVNQKYHTLYGWVEAECNSNNISFEKCIDEDVVYTKFAILKIREIQRNEEDDGGGSEDDGGGSEDDGSPLKTPLS